MYTWGEMADIVKQDIRRYMADTVLTPASIMRYLAQGFRTANRDVELVYELNSLQYDSGLGRYLLPPNVKTLVYVLDDTNKEIHEVSEDQFIAIKEKSLLGYNEVPFSFSISREDTDTVADWWGGEARVYCRVGRSLMVYPACSTQSGIVAYYLLDLPHFSSAEAYFSSWFAQLDFMAVADTTVPPDAWIPLTEAAIEWAKFLFLENTMQDALPADSRPRAAFHVERYKEEVAKALKFKQEHFRGSLPPYVQSPFNF